MSNEALQRMSMLAMGTFDGVHLGHKALIKATVELAKEAGKLPVIYTFSNHPRSVLAETPSALMTPEEKDEAIFALGVRIIEEVEFSDEFASTLPEKFILDLLHDFRVDTFLAGFNFRFGKDGAGNTALLRELGDKYGFNVKIIEPVTFNGVTVSSTEIRLAISSGEVEKAAKFIGEPYSIAGTIVSNRHIGRSLGFPTANLHMDTPKLIPISGVYITRARIDGKFYNAITNVGTNPTVNRTKDISIESNLLDFTGNIYGRDIRVYFLKRIRPEHKFAAVEELSAQITKDAETARTYFKSK
jgi:riboflavin kinase/FMN adenylyltransferase